MAEHIENLSDSHRDNAESTHDSNRGIKFEQTGITGGTAEKVIMVAVAEGNVACVLPDEPAREPPSRDLTNLATTVTKAVGGHGDPGGPVNMTGMTGGTSHHMNMIGVVNVTGQNDSLRLLEDATIEDAKNWSDGKIKVAAFDTVMSRLNDGAKWVTITGCPGEGKTTLGYMLLRKLKAQGKRVFNIETPEDFTTVKRECRDSVVMFNDILGSFTFDQSQLSKWEKVIQTVISDQKKAKGDMIATRVLFISRNNVLEVAKNHLGEYGKTILNESNTVNLGLTFEDKYKILKYHLDANELPVSVHTVEKVASGQFPHGFPHTCEIFATSQKQQDQEIDIVQFFTNPLEFLDFTTKALAERPNCLALFKEMVKRDGKLDSATIAEEDKRCRVNSAVQELGTSYVKKGRDIVQFSHPSIYISVGQAVADKDDIFLIHNASLSFLRQTLNIMQQGEGKIMGCVNVHESDTIVKEMVSRFKYEISDENFSVLGCQVSHNVTFCKSLLEETTTQQNALLQTIYGLTGQRKLNMNTRDESRRTMLSTASLRGNTTAVRTLVDRGADVNEGSMEIHSPLHWFCFGSGTTIDCLQVLIDNGADVNKRGDYKLTALHVLCANRKAKLDCIKYLVDHGSNIHAGDAMGMTALHNICTWSKDPESMKFLLEKGADVNQKDRVGETALHHLCSKSGKKESIQVLLDRGAEVNAQDWYGMTPLHNMCSNPTDHDIDCIELLLKRGADSNIKDKRGRVPAGLLNAKHWSLSEIVVVNRLLAGGRTGPMGIWAIPGRPVYLWAGGDNFNYFRKLLIFLYLAQPTHWCT